MFSEFESKLLEVLKIEEDITDSHVQGSACMLHPPSALLGFVNYTYVSPLNQKLLVLKFVTSVLKLEVTVNLLLKWLPLDQLNPVHLS